MKAAWIRNFWIKAVAFLLAAVIVPVMLTYAVGLACSYGGMGRDFYTSDLCLTAVGKKTWEICDDYIAMEGGNYDLDKIYSKGDSYSNIRFRVTWRNGAECSQSADFAADRAERNAGLPDLGRISGQALLSAGDRKSTRLNSSHVSESRMPSSA